MKFCPHCGGDLSQYQAAESSPSTGPEKYDQVRTWKALLERAQKLGGSPPTLTDLVEPVVAKMRGWVASNSMPTIIHLMFDKDIVPKGGALYRTNLGEGGRIKTPPEQMVLMGYAMLDGKVQVVEDVPVGPGYNALMYWGGEKQFRRWHLAEPIKIEPSRNGNPFFMDEVMIAFGATWRDTEKVGEALLNLLSLFSAGINGGPSIATPYVLDVALNAQD